LSSRRKPGSGKLMLMPYHVYILTTKKNTTLYTGVTSDLQSRIWQHKEGLIEGFSKKIQR